MSRMKFHFDWALYLIGIVYGTVVGEYIGWGVFGAAIAIILSLYLSLMILSIWQPVEPLERDDTHPTT